MTYRISTVADLTGIPRNTLLAWERRYGLVRPTRHENGYRSYSDQDVALILRLRNAIAAGLRIGEAVELVRKETTGGTTSESPEAQNRDFGGMRAELLQALVEYRRHDVEDILGRVSAIPLRERVREIYFPLANQVSSLFAQKQISLAQEHYASALLRSHWVTVLVATEGKSPSAPLAVTTTFTRDFQESVALILAIQLGAWGFRASYLGPSLTATELVRLARKQKPALACIACASPPSLEVLSTYTGELSSCTGTRWILGGPLPELTPPTGVLFCEEWSELSPETCAPRGPIQVENSLAVEWPAL